MSYQALLVHELSGSKVHELSMSYQALLVHEYQSRC